MATVDRSFLLSVVHIAVFLLPAVVAARARSSLTAGDILTPPNYITSPSGDFAFGFHSLDSNDSFLLAIWFQFDGTVVWFATDSSSGSAVVATPHSVLSFTAAGQLSLDNSLWNPDTGQVQSVRSLVVLRDSGNLQFVRADGTAIIWESFQHPTDTLLPGQLMRPGTRLRSRGTNSSIASMGRFSLVVQTDGNIVMYMLDQPGAGSANNAYWSTGTCCVDNGNTTLFFDDVDDSAGGAGHLYYVLTDGSKRNLTTPFSDTILQHSNTTASRLYYQHATLDPDGIFRVYIVPRRNTAAGKWAVVDMFPSDGCKTVTNSLHGMCGPNSYCIYRTDNKQLDCECPSGYTFLDAQFRYKGCIPSFVQDTCDGETHSSEFKLVELPNTNWARSVSYQTHASVTEERCSDLCLSNCLCAAALFDGNSSSCSEAGILTSGWQTNDTTVRTLIKVRTKRPPLLRALIPHYLMIAGLSVLVLVTTCILVVHCYINKQKQNARKRDDHLNARVFTRKELHRATNGFNRLLGQGGFGKVYHGVVKCLQPPHDVAVKELKSTDYEYKETEFENEVKSIGRIHHKNLVRMVGYCKEGTHRMLVFEFMPRGSLQDFLFRSSSEDERPPWSWRAGAAISIARGLEYLHYGCSTQIIHCDIKPDNILLDDKYEPRITDFGIARLLGDDKVKQTITHVRGTVGYLAPEWFISSDRRVDCKVDVFSFGVMLLEMICCRRWCLLPDHQQQDGRGLTRRRRNEEDAADDDGDQDDHGVAVTLMAWVADQIVREGNAERIIIQGDNEALQDLQRVERFARVALWCVQVDPSARPTMRSVVWMLEGTADVPPLPDPSPRARNDFSAILSSASTGTHDQSNVE
ncbi:hypothetical protein PR202_gb27916 [Eleusine coracana subsp. coracana]|uniref:Receptor-like serine/threonine-protein kinase n=1 Tax=Eleusine coracana subsp. coracana TaxID=191504 RepID=A0AAV5FVG5_ELECO|nr:hypothetical protein QOZ80_6AG0545140 [Eleusine coracana subsp. coracana]GJN38838.1 hypothetical protein PR202_gb27916 [Eleusine coracana subsp. coracana]